MTSLAIHFTPAEKMKTSKQIFRSCSRDMRNERSVVP